MSRKTVLITRIPARVGGSPRAVISSLALLAALFVSLTGFIGQARSDEPALLPDLIADPPTNVHEEPSVTEGGLKREAEPQLLLRFNGYIHNKGPGAIDFRGSREPPNVSKQTEEEVETARERGEPLPQKTEEELATPPMRAFQRVFTTNAEETNRERAHKEEPSAAELVYASADGHHHWHLQHAARYSLWNATKTAEVAPAQKAGFCLDDSEHIEANVGPSSKVYADSTGRDFCQQYRPNATSLFEGISAGWRDLYSWELAFQWVDASYVLPGEYWVRADVNPTGVIKETGAPKTPAYTKTTIRGFIASSQAVSLRRSEARTVTLTSKAWADSTTPKYAVVSGPQHGTLGTVSNNHVTYTPNAHYLGPDSFTFYASDPNSPFPRGPAIATVSFSGPKQPTVAIGGAPSSMISGTAVQLNAEVNYDVSGVTWEASAGSISPAGLYVAPPSPPTGGAVTVTARVRDDTSVFDQRNITILAVSPPQPAPAAPLPEQSPRGGALSSSIIPAVSEPRAILVGRTLVMTTRLGKAGRVRLTAYLGKRLFGSCAVKTPADRSFTCRVELPRGVSVYASISVWASLRLGREVLRSLRPASPVPRMTMPGGTTAHAAFASQFICSPSLTGTRIAFTSEQEAELLPALAR